MDSEHRTGHRLLLGFALGTFNVAFLLLALALYAYQRGDLAGSIAQLNTLTGLLVFGGLWMLNWWSTARAIRGWNLRALPSWPAVWMRGILRGGIAGAVALIALLASGVLLTLLDEGPSATLAAQLAILVFYGSIGLIFAFLTGAAVGFLLATIDRVLVGVAVIDA